MDVRHVIPIAESLLVSLFGFILTSGRTEYVC